jgi:hypothetical protein
LKDKGKIKNGNYFFKFLYKNAILPKGVEKIIVYIATRNRRY